MFAPDLRPDRFDRTLFSHGVLGLGVGLSAPVRGREVQPAPLGVRPVVADRPTFGGRRAPGDRRPAGRVDTRHRADEQAVNVFAFSASGAADWRWRIVNGETLEESSTRFPTMAEAQAAGTEQLQFRRDRDRPPPAQVPWRRRA